MRFLQDGLRRAQLYPARALRGLAALHAEGEQPAGGDDEDRLYVSLVRARPFRLHLAGDEFLSYRALR